MRVGFIGCVQFSRPLLARLLAEDGITLAGVVTRSASVVNGDFDNLADLADQAGVPCLMADGNDQKAMAKWLRDRAPDLIFCCGWSYLLHQEILSIPPLGVVGYHPTLLPRNRGRHPIIWALVLGLKRTGSTFFLMDQGADSGDILDQKVVEIAVDDDAGRLYAKLSAVAVEQVGAIAAAAKMGMLIRTPQDHSQASSWRKRSRIDGRIDWRMAAHTLHDLVRALTHPYPGAEIWRGDDAFPVWRSEIGPDGWEDVEPGRVLAYDGTKILVKCGIGTLWLTEHQWPYAVHVGESL